ncbi:lytic transglycosylase domain-containing protein [Spirosoma foliorum]|uniref:Lytic transglycosylase domain-containing protein n=1 Tax=Spirosoma foliorum TaxID=2710596 RepID=A0A7G5GR04_9BACT|nr:lytic transglycosylase domain-containing protein [Spirosoma foliorum]QMW01296.1 lytic transglycosylase domain-containing protein [Spirosoma foliorum]
MTVGTRYVILLLLSILSLEQIAVAQKKTTLAKAKGNKKAIRPLEPQRLHFCGEVVPTEQGDVSAKLALALAGSSGYIRHVNGLKARSAPFFAIIEPVLQKYNVPNDFKYLPLIESAWQSNAVSSAGAIGYWQFMDDTAQDMGLSIAAGNDERTDLLKSTEAACKYLKFLYKKLGSWTLVAAAYNGGVGMVQRKITKSGHRDYYSMTMNPETGYYLYRILAMKELFTNPFYGVGSAGTMLAYSGNLYEKEREQARRMGWLKDDEPEPEGVPIESFLDAGRPTKNEAMIMDSLLTELLKSKPASNPVFVGDVATRLVRAGLPRVGQSWAFTLTEDVQIGDDALKAGDMLYAIVDDIDSRGNLFLRATKAISTQENTSIPLTLLAMNPATGLAGVPRPKVVKPGWVVQWKL